MREKIVAGNIYHVLNRGVDKRKIFLNDKDYYRFIHDLFEFNDINPVTNFHHIKNIKDVGRPSIRKSRKLLVEILAFCLMPNHYHLLIKPKSDEGLSQFIKKLNGGYAKYFNEKYKRNGALFQGKYKSVLVKKEAHFIHLPYYIHLNPLDLIEPKWREGKLNNYKKAVEFLENYKWSSYQDYIGKQNFPSVTQREFLLKFFGGSKKYKKDILKWLNQMDFEETKEPKELYLE